IVGSGLQWWKSGEDGGEGAGKVGGKWGLCTVGLNRGEEKEGQPSLRNSGPLSLTGDNSWQGVQEK
nr:hypothetical protein [Tanacetum cinerariifolium]